MYNWTFEQIYPIIIINLYNEIKLYTIKIKFQRHSIHLRFKRRRNWFFGYLLSFLLKALLDYVL